MPGPISDGSGIRSTSAAGAIAAGSPPMSSAGNGQYYVSDNVSLSDNVSKPSRARYQRIVIGQKAVVVLKNNSAKNIGRVYLDFIFEDPATRMELLRYHFRANKDIAPGRVIKLKQDTYLRSKNASRFSPHPSGVLLERTDKLNPKVVVTRIEYTDGSIWER